MTFIPESDSRVVEAVKRIRGLRKLAITERMQTYRAQTDLLKQLESDVLATVAAVLSESTDSSTEETHRDRI